jgi:hypothetical protein
LGKTEERYIKFNTLVPYKDLTGALYFYDTTSLVSYKARESLARLYQEGFYTSYGTTYNDLKMHRIDEGIAYYQKYLIADKYYVVGVTFHFFKENNGQLEEILRIEDDGNMFSEMENTIFKTDKLYINLNRCSLVYNIKTNELENVFKHEEDDSLSRVVRIMPFGNDLYLYGGETIHRNE